MDSGHPLRHQSPVAWAGMAGLFCSAGAGLWLPTATPMPGTPGATPTQAAPTRTAAQPVPTAIPIRASYSDVLGEWDGDLSCCRGGTDPLTIIGD
jgi:hypothetical protein